jgi:hypothetical protein
MTGPEHFSKAEALAAKASEYLGRETGRTAPPSGPPSPRCTPPLAQAAATWAGPGSSSAARRGQANDADPPLHPEAVPVRPKAKPPVRPE